LPLQNSFQNFCSIFYRSKVRAFSISAVKKGGHNTFCTHSTVVHSAFAALGQVVYSAFAALPEWTVTEVYSAFPALAE
jgi:hypothetical protein